MPSALVPRVAALALGGALAMTSAPARAYHEGTERLVDGTAHTLRAGEVRIGLWDLDVGPTSWAMVGTSTAPWAASFLVGSVVANGHLKVRVIRVGPLGVSVTGALYHANIPVATGLLSGSGSLLLVPLSVHASMDLTHRLTLHLGATYAYAGVNGALDLQVGRARGTVATRAIQVHAMAEVRVSRVVALTLEGHAQPYRSAAAFRTTTSTDDGGSVRFAGTISPLDTTAMAALASVALSGRHVNARLGAGYGAVFLPSMGILIPYTTILPELDFYVRF